MRPDKKCYTPKLTKSGIFFIAVYMGIPLTAFNKVSKALEVG